MRRKREITKESRERIISTGPNHGCRTLHSRRKLFDDPRVKKEEGVEWWRIQGRREIALSHKKKTGRKDIDNCRTKGQRKDVSRRRKEKTKEVCMIRGLRKVTRSGGG